MWLEGMMVLSGDCWGVSRINLIADAHFSEEAVPEMDAWGVNEVELVLYAPSFIKCGA